MVNEKYIKGLTIGQRLAHVVEECGEVLAAAGKCQRWGFHSVNPELPENQQEQNYVWLLRELKDLEGAIARFSDEFEEISSRKILHGQGQIFMDEGI